MSGPNWRQSNAGHGRCGWLGSGGLFGVSVPAAPRNFISFFLINLFIYFYFWPRWIFVAVRRLSLVAVSGGYSSLRCAGFSLRWLLLLWSTDSRRTGSVVVAHGLSSRGTRA